MLVSLPSFIQGQSQQPAESVYKNIKVLQGTPSDQLLPAMQFISSALGVRCDHCHIENAFEKDDKEPKKVARQMITMMFQINRENFQGERRVTCYSCHRGGVRPAAIPAIAGQSLQEATDATAVPKEPVDQVLRRYLQAVGGAEAVTKIDSKVEKGRVTLAEGVEVPVEILTRRPAQRAMVMHSPSGKVSTVYDGRSGWIAAPNRPVRDLSSSENQAAIMEADPHFPVNLTQYFKDIQFETRERIGADTLNVLRATRPGMPPVRLYFHPRSGLLVRIVRFAESPLGLNPTQIDYSDYRTQNGVRIPFLWTVSQPEGKFSVRLDTVELNVPIDDATFQRPRR